MVHLDYPISQSPQQLQLQPPGGAAVAEAASTTTSTTTSGPDAHEDKFSRGRSPPVEFPSATFPPSEAAFPPDSSHPTSLSTSIATGSTAAPPVGTAFYTFPPDAELKTFDVAAQKKRASQLWLFLFVAGGLVLFAIIVGVAVAVTNSMKSIGPAQEVTVTTTPASETSSSIVSSSSPATLSSSSASRLTQSTSGNAGATSSQDAGQQQQTTDQPTTQQPTTQETFTQQTNPPQTTSSTKADGFQIRLSGSNQCVVGSSLQTCESSPGSSSPQVFVESGSNWKQVSSGQCLQATVPILSLATCNSNNGYQNIIYDVSTIQAANGHVCVKPDLSLVVDGSPTPVNPADCGKFDRV
ncbi:hypothetical protein DFJ73DRAFT_926127 [Zopfochytrium polystomum]|nr:hypothetical protein DFJ73DRAFT_926127 [Zopfochytrium polystomum]